MTQVELKKKFVVWKTGVTKRKGGNMLGDPGELQYQFMVADITGKSEEHVLEEIIPENADLLSEVSFQEAFTTEEAFEAAVEALEGRPASTADLVAEYKQEQAQGYRDFIKENQHLFGKDFTG